MDSIEGELIEALPEHDRYENRPPEPSYFFLVQFRGENVLHAVEPLFGSASQTFDWYEYFPSGGMKIPCGKPCEGRAVVSRHKYHERNVTCPACISALAAAPQPQEGESDE